MLNSTQGSILGGRPDGRLVRKAAYTIVAEPQRDGTSPRKELGCGKRADANKACVKTPCSEPRNDDYILYYIKLFGC